MESTHVKVMLPPPNFAKKPSTTPSEPTVSPHFLSPAGMTLLPSSKQPPPMYGSRGATVPAKYLPVHKRAHVTQQSSSSDERHWCEPCEMELQSQNDFRLHRKQHECCPIDGCKYQGHPSVMVRHVEALHTTGLYEKFRKFSTPDEIAAWREERRKRYPTCAHVEARRLAQEQRRRRGEKLGTNKSRFGCHRDRVRAVANRYKSKEDQSNQIECKDRARNQHKKQLRDKRIAFNQRLQADQKKVDTSNAKVDECASTTTIPTERVEKIVEDDPFFGTVNTSTTCNSLTSLISAYGSDESEEDEEPKSQTTHTIDEQENCDLKMKIEDAHTNITNEDKKGTTDAELQVANVVEETPSPELDIHEASKEPSSDDEPPEETSIVRHSESTSSPAPRPSTATQHAKKKTVLPPRRPRRYGLDLRKAQLRKQNTMLEKLLESDIRHERNVLLQCVRFVCENNFFRKDVVHNTSST